MQGQSPVIILVRPQMAENIGMVARAMANFGLSRLRLVAPRDGWPPAEAAFSTAAGAAGILDRADVFPTVAAAAADLSRLFATTARERGQAKPVMIPEAAMGEVGRHAEGAGKVGILFGPERTGLDNDEISLADTVLTFPVEPGFSSLNLAQAVLLVAYEWRRASGQDSAPFALPQESGPVRRETLFAFFDFIERELDRIGFYTNAERRPVIVRNFRNIIHRMAPSEQDIRSLRGVFDALLRGGRGRRGSQSGEGT